MRWHRKALTLPPNWGQDVVVLFTTPHGSRPCRFCMTRQTHEGMVVTDGQHQFLIRDGRRVWISTPPPALRAELLIEAERLRISRSFRPKLP